jgi:PAS domain S-box-containing protein
LAVRPRQIAPVALLLALTIAGFAIARALAERAERRDAEHGAEVAAAQIRGRVAQAASLTQSLARFMLDASGTGVTSDQFARNALRWLSPARFPAAAWVEQVPDSRRAAYERRIGQPIVTPDDRHSEVPRGSRSSYLPATLVSGFPPMAVSGIDLSGTPGIRAALTRATRLNGVVATPIAPPSTGTHGLFLVAPAPNLIDEVLRPGYVVVFVSDRRLRAAATDAPVVRIMTAGASTEAGESADTASETFTAARQRFDVAVPEQPVQGAAAVLPWIVLAGGLVVAVLSGALELNAGRRARAQDELDRIFTLSSDPIVVASFDGYFTRVNPATERLLGFTERELLARPYLDFVHPDDRERTVGEAAAIAQGKATLSFENRFVHKDGSYRLLEWTATPVVEEGVMYSVARDVTERRRAEAEVERLAEEQAALRRVATRVAQGASPQDLLEAVAEEVGRLLPVEGATMGRFEPDGGVTTVGSWSATEAAFPTGRRWPTEGTNVASIVLQTGQSARIDDFSTATDPIGVAARAAGYTSAVGTPIVVEGRLWGVITATSSKGPMPPGTEARLASFTDLVATAIANAESREALAQLAEEQAALRRVATLVAENVPSAELCAAVAREAGTLLGADYAGMIRYDDDATVTSMATWAATGELPPIPDRFRTEPGDPTTMVAETRRPARVDDWTVVPGPLAAFLRDELAVRSSVGSPIVVEGRLWGVLGVHSKGIAPLPPDTESRIGQFTQLVATAIANREARTEVARLADEQAALRRVATLVARDAPREEVFTVIASEIGHLFGLEEIRMVRYDDHTGVVVASSGPTEDFFPVDSRVSVDADSAASRVLRTGEPVRIDDYGTATGAIGESVRSRGICSVVAAPISVEGRLWGAITAGTTQDEPLPPATESRLGQFTELMASAVANTESRAEVERLAEEQAALRRVATLVAEGASPSAVFDAVAGEMEGLLDADQVALNRFEAGDEIVVLAHRGLDVARTPVGSRLSIEGESVTATVRRTGRPARMETYEGVPGALAELARATGLRASVSAPIVVEGRRWGLITASWKGEQSPPADTEERMSRFAQLLDTAIANAEARAELMASRARLVGASDEARRRFERDLHDGVQQRLVTVSLELRGAEAMAPPDDQELAEQLTQVGKGLAEALEDLRELSRGIHPAILSEAGLVPALKTLARRSAVPVQLDLAIKERLAERVEIGAYYVVSEALTNVAKHARASVVEVHARARDGVLELKIDDDGVGGADPSRGTGLTGLADRVEALGGTIWIASPPGEGTSLRVELSLDSQ